MGGGAESLRGTAPVRTWAAVLKLPAASHQVLHIQRTYFQKIKEDWHFDSPQLVSLEQNARLSFPLQTLKITYVIVYKS